VHLVGFIIRIFHDARSPERQKCARDIKSIFPTAIATFNKKILFTRKFDLNFRKKVLKFCVWSMAVCVA